ncbi:helicase-related protein [Tessaracoccus lubricantis]|uniref:Helicase-related protein n=1 Tax=Tessaracoccus lubricantis TaxID=545543 RepID=A0ABP9F2E5_9ACTN
MDLGDIKQGQLIHGVVPGQWVKVLGALPQGETAVHLAYQTQGGAYGGQLVLAAQAEGFALAGADRRLFDADPADFRIAAEAMRIRDAAKYDPFLSVSTSDVRPLPHQLKAVYEELLPRVPLRFLLADDPGAGKTIMAGLYIKQLMLRDDVRRCLIVAPGGLVEQWQDELQFKFGLEFSILTNEAIQASLGSIFDKEPRLIARMDHLARNEELLGTLGESHWDLVVVDEAHRMGAHYFGKEAKKTKRFQLGETLRDRTRHFLLMTATPHAGKEEDFQLFLTLLDRDTFAGRPREGVTRSNPKAFMRRMVKEDLLTLEGRALFPPRVATTINYELTHEEQYLYERVSDYVRTEMNRADKLDGKRKNTVGFALTVLQRRLASSPEAILQSLTRRSARLAKRRDDVINGVALVEPDATGLDGDEEEFPSDAYEEAVEEVVDSATSARTVAELDAELASLAELTDLARKLRMSGRDIKWQELSRVIQAEVLADGSRKLIVFTEHRDTLEYLRHRISALLARPESVVAIHGGVNRKERRRITAEFTHNDEVQFLIATDAAGEGLNLQAAHLMVNYDLPWNPNRIEQRFGRVHRIGQQEVCQLWNLVATSTREGDVYATLLNKLEEMRRAYGGKVFDVLGEAFSAGESLKDLLMEAIRKGDDPAVRARMLQVIDHQAGAGLKELIERNDLDGDTISASDVEELRRQMDEAYARRLAPHFIEAAFAEAFTRQGGRWARREAKRFEIGNVPAVFRQDGRPVATRYQRVTFEPAAVEGDAHQPRAELLAPGHALHDGVLEQALIRWGSALEKGAVFSSELLVEPHLLVGVAQEIADGAGEVIDLRFAHLLINQAGEVFDAGPAPYLDLAPATPEQLVAAQGLGWLAEAESRAIEHCVETQLPEQLAQLAPQREEQMTKLWEAVYHRLNQEIRRLGEEALVATAREAQGMDVKESSELLTKKAEELAARLRQRESTIAAQRMLVPAAPRPVSFAVVVPDEEWSTEHAKETERVERRAVEKVLATERALGRKPVEQHRLNPGFDILSQEEGELPLRIEVKGRIKGATDFTITFNEVMTSLNTQPRFRLAMVSVDPDGPAGDEIRYVDDPFQGMAFGAYHTGKMSLPWKATWAKGYDPSPNGLG